MWLAFLVPFAPVQQCALSDAPTSYAFSPVHLAAADFDHDGRADFAMSLGDSRFAVAVQSPVGTYPRVLPTVPTSFFTVAIAAGLVDGDSNIDVVVAGTSGVGGSSAAISRGNGDGTFQTPVAIAGAPSNSANAALADLDGDSLPDLALAARTANAVYVFLNNGAGGFGAPNVLPMGAGHDTYDVAIAQMDGDAIPDLVVGSLPGTVSVLRGLGAGAFAAPVHTPLSTPGVPQLAVGHLNGDSALDVAAISATAVYVLANDGSGGLASVHSVVANDLPRDVAIADLDRDGKLDLAFTIYHGQVGTMLNLGANSFAPPRYFAAGPHPYDVALADVNGDNLIDAVFASAERFRIAFGDGHGGFRTPERLDSGMPANAALSKIQRADFDLDGRDDIVYQAGDSRIGVKRADGSGGLGSAQISIVPFVIQEFCVAQMNADAIPDLVFVFNGGAAVSLGNGSGGFAPATVVSGTSSVMGIAAGDVTGDGLADVLCGEVFAQPFPPYFTGTRVQIHPGNGAGGLGAPFYVTSGTAPYAIAVGNFDGVGAQDFVVLHSNETFANVFLAQGGGAFSPLPFTAGYPTRVQAADFDGDSDLDLFVNFPADGRILLNNGAAVFMPGGTIHGLGFSYTDEDVADFDADGLPDLVRFVGWVDYFHNDGGGNFSWVCGDAFCGSMTCDSIVALDVDANGLPEIAAVHSGATSGITLHESGIELSMPAVYCAAKINSLGCLPAIHWLGASSASASSGFVVNADRIRNQKIGMLLYSITGRAALPFLGGTLCLANPRRTVGVFSNGTPTSMGNDCTGTYQLDMNAYAAGVYGGNPQPALRQFGTRVDCQFWGRDPGFPPPNGVSLTDALEYDVMP